MHIGTRTHLRWRAIFVGVLLSAFAVVAGVATTTASADTNFQRIYQEFLDASNPNVLVVAHRGGYRHDGAVIFPENSLSAMAHSIFLGVDILEIDVKKTSDGHLVVMHDSTVNRTTSGSGTVSSMTLAQVKDLRLLKNGQVTDQQVPTLEEVMSLAKDEIMVYLDHSWNKGYWGDILDILETTDTVDQAIFYGDYGFSTSQAQAELAALGTHVSFKPKLGDNQDLADLQNYIDLFDPDVVSIRFSSETSVLISSAALDMAEANDTRIWMNSLASYHAAGRTDAGALTDPDGNWGWIVDHGAQILQTDEPENLVAYLASRGLHLPGPLQGDFNFDKVIDVLDYQMSLIGLKADLSGLTAEEAYQMGDMNGDFLNNHDDVVLFRVAYDAFNGDGAFAVMFSSVPEPSTCALIVVGLLLILSWNGRFLLPG